ncbi:hypothetical protein H8E06_00330 [bacterium]|nr:hypothetical protein [bacterium]
MKDKDHNLLEEAWQKIYMDDNNISPEDAAEKNYDGESLMVTTADGVEFVVAGDDDEGVVDNNGLLFQGHDPDGQEVSARAEEISMIKSLSDRESIRGGFDDNKSHEAQFQGDPEMAQQGKPVAWESAEKSKIGEEGCGGHDNKEDMIKHAILKKIKLMKPESTRVTERSDKKKKVYVAKRDLTTNTPSGPMTIKAGEPINYDRIHQKGLVSSHFFGYGQPQLYTWEDVEELTGDGSNITFESEKDKKKKEDEERLRKKMEMDALMAQYGGYDSGS